MAFLLSMDVTKIQSTPLQGTLYESYHSSVLFPSGHVTNISNVSLAVCLASGRIQFVCHKYLCQCLSVLFLQVALEQLLHKLFFQRDQGSQFFSPFVKFLDSFCLVFLTRVDAPLANIGGSMRSSFA